MTLDYFKALVNTLPRRHRYRVAGVALALERAIAAGEDDAAAVARIGGDPSYLGALVDSGQVTNFQSIAPPAPVLDRLSVSTFVIGQRNISVHCFGSGFTPGCAIFINNIAERTDFWSPNDVSTGIYSDLWTAPAVLPVKVVNPDSGGQSQVLDFTIVAEPVLVA